MKVTIVSSAIEETWPTEGKVIFLGQWCCIYSRKARWQKMNYEIAEYHWDDREKLKRDYQLINDYYEFYLRKLAAKLNEIHGTNFSVRYWRILIGWWLFYFIGVLFDRWQIVKNVEKKYPNASTFCVSNSVAKSTAQSMKEFMISVTQDVFWNENVFALLIENFSTIGYQEVRCESINDLSFKTETDAKIEANLIGKMKSILRKAIYLLSERKIFYGNGISIESSHLSRFNLLKLFLINRQLPYSLNFEPLSQFNYSSGMRDWSLPSMAQSEFDEVLDFFIPRYLPQTYIEGYHQIKMFADKKLERKKFKIVVTAQDFSGNDSWAAWAAKSVEDGSRLVVMQHGGLYGVNTFSATEDHEIAIADKFLSWGWRRRGNQKVTPAPAAKLIHLKAKAKFRNNGTALLIAGALPQQSYHLSSIPIGPQFATYFEDQFSFVSALSPNIREKLRVRMFPSDSDWFQELRWRDFDPAIQLLKDGKSLAHNLKKTKISIATYNATTFLETFVRSIPTVIFWDKNYWELNEFARPYYEKLQEARVLFYDPKECAKHINEVWDNPSLWWNDPKTKSAVKEFMENFANVPKNAIFALSELIKSDC
jgi:putative transferase (TIGR04331 family)